MTRSSAAAISPAERKRASTGASARSITWMSGGGRSGRRVCSGAGPPRRRPPQLLQRGRPMRELPGDQVIQQHAHRIEVALDARRGTRERLGGQVDRRADPVFMAGLVLFALASLAGGFAQNDIQLVIARAVQGLGAAIVSPAALSIITVTFKEGAERNKVLRAGGVDPRLGRCCRRPPRRRPHRRPRLGVGALGQRPDRDRRRALLAPRLIAESRSDLPEPPGCRLCPAR